MPTIQPEEIKNIFTTKYNLTELKKPSIYETSGYLNSSIANGNGALICLKSKYFFLHIKDRNFDCDWLMEWNYFETYRVNRAKNLSFVANGKLYKNLSQKQEVSEKENTLTLKLKALEDIPYDDNKVLTNKHLDKILPKEIGNTGNGSNTYHINIPSEDGFMVSKVIFSRMCSALRLLHSPEFLDVEFPGVFGLEKAKESLIKFIIANRYPDIKEYFDMKTGDGVLLYGPPGNGKTKLAQCVANIFNMPMEIIRGGELRNMLYGISEQKVREVFNRAKKNAPSIIFFDEIDSIGKSRKYTTQSLESNILEQILSMWGNTEQNKGVLVIGATNRKEDLDEALTRSGRFGVHIEVSNPDEKSREKMFKKWLGDKFTGNIEDITNAVKLSEGMSGADIEKICDDAKNKAFNALLNGEEPCVSPDMLFSTIKERIQEFKDSSEVQIVEHSDIFSEILNKMGNFNSRLSNIEETMTRINSKNEELDLKFLNLQTNLSANLKSNMDLSISNKKDIDGLFSMYKNGLKTMNLLRNMVFLLAIFLLAILVVFLLK